jgi:hypothetical protein
MIMEETQHPKPKDISHRLDFQLVEIKDLGHTHPLTIYANIILELRRFTGTLRPQPATYFESKSI